MKTKHPYKNASETHLPPPHPAVFEIITNNYEAHVFASHKLFCCSLISGWTPAVARQGPDPDGVALEPDHLRVLKEEIKMESPVASFSLFLRKKSTF